MIRILHSVSNMDRAGIETMLMNYYRYMDKSKVQFDFLCNKKKPGAYDDEIKSMGGRIYHTPGLNPAKYPVYLKYMRELFQEHPEYKIVEAHNGALGVYALHAAKVSKIPVRIFHAHGASITKDWKLPIKLVCKACLPTNMTHHFSCGVEAAKCYFGQKVVDENDYVLIPNAIDVARFIYNPKIRNKIRKENNLENKHVVGHVGRFMAQKNHTFLMDVFAEVLKIDSQAHLVLLGDGELMDEIKRKTADLGISEHVTFVGNVGNANEWYQAFDCFVLPSIWEGLPVVGVEAQAADLPCVFSSAITREIGLSQRAKFVPLTESVSVWAKTLCDALQQNERNDNTKLITEHHYNIAFEAKKLQESGETIENFGGNSSTGLSSRMIQLSGITWMLIHNAVFGLGASCHTRGKLSYRINGIWQVRDTIDNGYVGYFVEEGLLGGIACFSLFYSLLKSSWKRATFKNSRNMNNSFFLCFVSYVAVMLSVADVSQLLWVIIALYITYNAKAQAIASE